MAILDTTKMLLGIADNTQDGILTYLINTVTTDVLTYCRTSNAPDSIQSIITDMVVDRYRARGYGSAQAPQTATLIAEGDTKVELKTAALNSTMELTEAEMRRLLPFRKLWP